MLPFKQYLTEAKEISPIRWTGDIKLYATVRPPSTCKACCTKFCLAFCYTTGNYTAFDTKDSNMTKSDKVSNAWFNDLKPNQFFEDLKKYSVTSKYNTDGGPSWSGGKNADKAQFKRFRICSRGEPFAKGTDLKKWRSIANATPKMEFWAPTRCWNPQRTDEEWIEMTANMLKNPDSMFAFVKGKFKIPNASKMTKDQIIAHIKKIAEAEYSEEEHNFCSLTEGICPKCKTPLYE